MRWKSRAFAFMTCFVIGFLVAGIVVREPHEPERDVAFVASKAGASVVKLAASVGALPEANDYISLFDVNVQALKSATAR